jgi:hypothetical protein
MKKTIKVFAMVVCMATIGMLCSCTKDYADLIVGKWEQAFYTENGSHVVEIPEEEREIWEFKASGEVVAIYQGEAWRSSTYSVDGDKLISGGDTCIIKKLDKETLAISINEIASEEDELILTFNRL